MLYESELRRADPIATLGARLAQSDPPVPEYAVELVEGVVAHRAALDELLSGAISPEWTLERMPAVDRSLLRVALFELLYRADVPAAVVINEAVGLAGDLSTENSSGFVNGVLGRLLSEKPAAATP